MFLECDLACHYYEMDSRPALRLTDLIIVVHEEY